MYLQIMTLFYCFQFNTFQNDEEISQNLKTKSITDNYKQNKRIWISQNPLLCNCSNLLFLSHLQKHHTKVS